MGAPDQHLPWCSESCASVITGTHESRPVAVLARGTEPVAVTVAMERLEEQPPVNLVVLELVEDDKATQYRLQLGQVLALQHELRCAVRRLARG